MENKQYQIKKNIFGFGLTSSFNDFSHEMATAVLPAFVEQLVGQASTPSMLGIISGISDAAASLVRVYSGILTDRIKNYKFFLIIGYALTPLFSGLIGTANYIWQIMLYKTIAWTGKGLREPMRDTWIAQIVHPSRYGQAFGFVRAFDTVGAILGPLVAFIALKYCSLRTIFFISFIPGIASVAALILLTKEEKVHAITQHVYHWKQQLQNLPKRFNYFVAIMFIFGIGNFNKMLIIYRAQEVFTGEKVSSVVATSWAILLYVLFNIVRSISEYSLGTLSDYVSRKNILAIMGFGLFGLASSILMASPTSMIVWFIIFLAAGISTGTVTSVEKAYSAQLLPTNVRGTGFGLLQMFDGIGDLASSVIVGYLWVGISPASGFLYAAVMSFIAMILLLFFNELKYR
jgi:MFS family permease